MESILMVVFIGLIVFGFYNLCNETVDDIRRDIRVDINKHEN
jgi:hypothetical protein